MAVPRIGQEVIVSYLNGDIDRPIVTGCTYNGLNRPPLNLPAEKTRTTFKTRTHKGKGFNELRFEDAKDQEELFIHAQRDMKNQILSEHTDLVSEHESLRHRLRAAYNYLLELNFQEQNMIQSDLYLVAFNPDFQYASSIKSALESPGQKPEQQFKDFLRIAKNKMNRRR